MMSFQDQMKTGYEHSARHDWSRAYACFQRAHDLGHGGRSTHLAAHRAALAVAWRGLRVDRVVYQLTFLGFASLTSWRVGAID
jgi:hypothetical protein